MKRQFGFTLIEVMLAMAITVLVGVLAYNSLSVSLVAARHNDSQVKRLADIQSAITLLERDIRQAALRGIVDQYGDRQPALSGGAVADYPLQLTRFGWDNPGKLQRSEVQRVRYRLEDERLWRDYWPVLDLIEEEEGIQSLPLLDGVTELSLQFLNDRSPGAQGSPLGGEWQDHWHPSLEEDRLPLAVELKIEIERFGKVRRVIQVAAPI